VIALRLLLRDRHGEHSAQPPEIRRQPLLVESRDRMEALIWLHGAALSHRLDQDLGLHLGRPRARAQVDLDAAQFASMQPTLEGDEESAETVRVA
jgi:hypothetical protein